MYLYRFLVIVTLHDRDGTSLDNNFEQSFKTQKDNLLTQKNCFATQRLT
jgi:hypothetical protein